MLLVGSNCSLDYLILQLSLAPDRSSIWFDDSRRASNKPLIGFCFGSSVRTNELGSLQDLQENQVEPPVCSMEAHARARARLRAARVANALHIVVLARTFAL